MPDETRALAPLTPEQWKRVPTGRPCYEQIGTHGHFALSGDRDGIWIVDDAVATRVFSEDLFALMALANAALPEGDPRKITHADVRMLDHVGNEYEMVLPLMEKLAALLPPV